MTNSIKNIQVTYSRTREAYNHKPTGPEYNKMVFEKKTATPEAMLADLIGGASTAPIFKKDIINSKERTNDNFVGSQYWYVDIDFDVHHATLGSLMKEFTGHDDLNPTFAYSTVTNKVYMIASEYNKSGIPSSTVVNRYRLVYVSDCIVYGKERCNAIATHIRDSVDKLLNEGHGYNENNCIDIDTCSNTPTQMMHGNGRPLEMYNQTYIFWDDAAKKFVNPDKTRDKKWFDEHTVDENGNELMLHTTSVSNIGGVEASISNRIYSFSDAEIDAWIAEYPSKHKDASRTAKNGVAEGSEDITSMFSMMMQTMLVANDSNYTIVDDILKAGWEPIQRYNGRTTCNGMITVLPDYVDPSINVFVTRRGEKTERMCVTQGSRSKALFGIACRTYYSLIDSGYEPWIIADNVLCEVLWFNRYFIDNSLEPIERREMFNIVRDALSKTREELVKGMTEKRIKKGKKVKGRSGFIVSDTVAKGAKNQVRRDLVKDCTQKAIQLAMSNVFDRDCHLKVTTVEKELKEMFDRGELLDVTGRPRRKPIRYNTISEYFVELGLKEKRKKVDKNLGKLNVNMTIEEIMDTLGCCRATAFNYKAQLRHNEKVENK